MLVHLKDQTPLNLWAEVIYKVPGGDCPKVFITRQGGHWATRRALTSINLTQSALAERAAAHDHAIDWGRANIVNQTPVPTEMFAGMLALHVPRCHPESRGGETPPPQCITNWLSRQVTGTLPQDPTTVKLLSFFACFHSVLFYLLHFLPFFLFLL